MKGRTPAGTARRYRVHFGAGPNATPAEVRLTDNVDCEGQSSFRVTTPPGTYTYHKEGAGFASLKDRDGVEWIGYRPGGRSAGEFRGIPNLGDFGHPGYTGDQGAESRVLAAGPLVVRILSERRDKKWLVQWDIFPGFARMTLLRHEKPYWFLYEGTPGGALDEKEGFQVLSTGLRRSLGESWAADMPDPEWIYFGGAKAKRVLYLVNHQRDGAPDQYWPMDGNMTVFGFGRQYRCCGMYLNTAPARFTIGLAEQTEFAEVAKIVEGAWRDVELIVLK
jgi:hypothetical protein